MVVCRPGREDDRSLLAVHSKMDNTSIPTHPTYSCLTAKLNTRATLSSVPCVVHCAATNIYVYNTEFCIIHAAFGFCNIL